MAIRSGGSGPVKAAVESTAPPTGTEEILVVEDESAVRALCEKLLKSLNYRVTVAENGEAAVAALERRGLKPDLLITDLVMPGMNGRELATRIRQHRPGLKVLYMSGYTDRTVDDQGILNAGTLFLQKPFTLSSLAMFVRQALETPPQ